MHLDEGASLLDGKHGGLELLRIRGASGEVLHGGGGGGDGSLARQLYARAWVLEIGRAHV